ncbi:hypothetical protein J2Y03_004684 [Neobacillus niacini]|nr:hypothetical protein [Neobacillus niacini]
MKKKLFLLLAGSVLSVSMLAGCFNRNQNPPPPVNDNAPINNTNTRYNENNRLNNTNTRYNENNRLNNTNTRYNDGMNGTNNNGLNNTNTRYHNNDLNNGTDIEDRIERNINNR